MWIQEDVYPFREVLYLVVTGKEELQLFRQITTNILKVWSTWITSHINALLLNFFMQTSLKNSPFSQEHFPAVIIPLTGEEIQGKHSVHIRLKCRVKAGDCYRQFGLHPGS